MKKDMENLLTKTIIEATKVNQTDIAIERMTKTAVLKNLSAQKDLVRSQQSRLNDLQDDFNSLNYSVKNKDLEIRQLREKLRIAISMYEEANDATGAWIDLLNKPLHEIAKKHQGFNSNFSEMLGDFSRIILENMVRGEAVHFMANKLEYSPLEVDILLHKFENLVLEDNNPENENSIPLISHFHEELTKKHKDDTKKIKQKIIKADKNYKI